MKYVEVDGIEFEALTTFDRVARNCLVNPMINYILPRRLLRAVIRKRSPLLDACIKEPGSWECMRLSYERREGQGAVGTFVEKYGSIPMALRNRKRMTTTALGELISQYDRPVHIVGVAAGTGHNIMEGMLKVPDKLSHAYMIDLSDGATGFGQELAKQLGLDGRTTFIQGNVLEIEELMDVDPDITVAVGILEYFTDEQVVELATAMYRAAPHGGSFLANSILPAHGSDRFLRTVLGLHLNYREPEGLRSLLSRAGYVDFSVRSEPLGIYSILVGHKR
jgi:hypothetical protein